MLEYIDDNKHEYEESYKLAKKFRRTLKTKPKTTLEMHISYKLAKQIRGDKGFGSPKMTTDTMKRFLFEGIRPNSKALDAIVNFLEWEGYEVTGLELKKK